VTVETFISNGKGGSNGPILIKLIGDVESEFVTLSETGYMTSMSSNQVGLPIVGDIKIISIRNEGNFDWYCKSIKLVKV